MMNSMKVPVPSSTPIGLTRMNIQASPKNRSSTMKRMRQARLFTALSGSARNWRHLVMMMAWMTRTALVQVPAVMAPTQRLDRNPTAPTRSRITSDADSRFCANRRNNSLSKAGRVPVVEVSRSRASRTCCAAARRRLADDPSGDAGTSRWSLLALMISC